MSHNHDGNSHYNVYSYHMTNPSETISQALATAVRTKRSGSSSSNGSSIKVEPYLQNKAGLSSSISQFLAKLWRLVNDRDTDDKICWSEDGLSFIVKDQSTFSMELLPRYFKHHNFSSFVRQLNMYGFRKMVNTEHGGLRCIKDDYQFINKNFCRDRPELLELVKRKPSSTTHTTMHHPKDFDDNIGHSLKKVLGEVHHLRKDNERIKHSFEKLKEENNKLYNDVETLNEKNNNQSIIIQKIIKFLWSLVHQQNSLASKQSRMMIENGGERQRQYSEMTDQQRWEHDRSRSVSPVPARNPGKFGERVNKVGSELESIQSLLSQNFSIDSDVVNDLFESTSEYMSPAMSPAPNSAYNSSAPPSPGPSGLASGQSTAANSPASFNVQVEQYQDEIVPSTMSMASPSYIQHPSSPVQSHRQPSPVRSPMQHRRSTQASPVPSPLPQQSPLISPHVSPCISPYVSPHISPHVSPHISPGASPAHSVQYQQMSYPGVTQCSSPVFQQQSMPIQGTGSPVRQYSQPQYDHYQRSPGKQPYPYHHPDQGQGQGGMSEHVVKKPKLSAYSQNIQWEEEEEEEEEEETKIDPSSFFTK